MKQENMVSLDADALDWVAGGADALWDHRFLSNRIYL